MRVNRNKGLAGVKLKNYVDMSLQNQINLKKNTKL